jgi:hypothetical protein
MLTLIQLKVRKCKLIMHGSAWQCMAANMEMSVLEITNKYEFSSERRRSGV